MVSKYPKARAGGDGVFKNKQRVPESQGGHGIHNTRDAALREPAQVGPDPADGPIGDDLDALSYKRLQEIAKERGVSAAGKRDEILERLRDYDTATLDQPDESGDDDLDAAALDDQPDED